MNYVSPMKPLVREKRENRKISGKIEEWANMTEKRVKVKTVVSK